MKRKDIAVGMIYETTRHGKVKVVDLGPFERTYNGFGDRMTIDGIETQTRRSPEGRHIAVREVRRDGTLAEWIDLATPGMLRPTITTREDSPTMPKQRTPQETADDEIRLAAEAAARITPASVAEAADAVKPTVPTEAAEAALIAFERGSGYSNRERVRWAVAASLPHLMPGLYVTREPNGDATIWEENSPARPHRPWPTAMLQRAQENAPLFDVVAALLPDRTEDTLREALADSAVGLTADLGDFTQYVEEDPR